MKDNAAYGFLTKSSDIKDDSSHPSLRRFSDRSLVIGHCLDFCPDPVLPGIKAVHTVSLRPDGDDRFA